MWLPIPIGRSQYKVSTPVIDPPDINWGIDFTALSTYGRDLPHWRQEGAVYFVTFRLADSIPRSVIEAWHEELERIQSYIEENPKKAGLQADAAIYHQASWE